MIAADNLPTPTPTISHAILCHNAGRSERLAEATLRFGLGRFTTAADIEVAVQTVTESIQKLRRISGYQSAGRQDVAGVLASAS